MCSTANIPGTLIAPMVPGQALMGPAAPCSWVGEKGVLEGAAFAQHPQLLLSLTPMLKRESQRSCWSLHTLRVHPQEPWPKCAGTAPAAAEKQRGHGQLQLLPSDTTGVSGAVP